MNRFASAVAALALVSAFAAPVAAEDGRLRFGDLDLSTAAGAADLDARIEGMARTLCRGSRAPASLISDRAFCQDAVRREVMRQLPAAAREDYARARSGRISA